MSMFGHSRFLIISLLATILLSGCSAEELENTQLQAPRYVKLATVTQVPDVDEFTFPAVVSAVKTVDLSFEISGRLTQTNLVTGSDISKGTLLATIDQAPFIRGVDESKTRFEQAKRELKRIEQMFTQNLVAQSALDAAKTAYELALIKLKNAEQDLSYTQLFAPFDGKVSQRLVENNSFVNAATPIARLQDLSKIYFNINVPERLLTANIGRGILTARASLATNQKQWYDVNYVERSTQPDPISQTYEIVFAMDPIDQLPLTPGARAIVRVQLQGTVHSKGVVVPINALVGDANNGFAVWIYNQKGTVEKRQVMVLNVVANSAIVEGNIDIGQQVIAAGANQMHEGIKVAPYQGEQ